MTHSPSVKPDQSFDAVRSERTLQWVIDPALAIREIGRVLRPGGRISLIDTDWSTLRLDVGDAGVASMVDETLRSERSRPSNIGSRLTSLVTGAGFDQIKATAATQVWTHWDPDRSPAPDGCFSMSSLADNVVDAGHLDSHDAGRFVATILDAARRGRFFMSLTMFGISAVRPE